MITWWMKLGGHRPPGDNPLLFSISGTGSLISGWTYQGLWLPSRGALRGKPKCSVPRVGLEPTTHQSGVERATNCAPVISLPNHGPLAGKSKRSTVGHVNHQTMMTAPSRRIKIYPGSSTGCIFSLLGGSSVKTAPPRVGPRGQKYEKKIQPLIEPTNQGRYPIVKYMKSTHETLWLR